MIPPNNFTRTSILAVISNSFGVKIERLNCMPKTPEVFYPNYRLYGYDDIFENLTFEKEMEEYYNINKFRAEDIFERLRDVPAGVCAIIKPDGSCIITK